MHMINNIITTVTSGSLVCLPHRAELDCEDDSGAAGERWRDEVVDHGPEPRD